MSVHWQAGTDERRETRACNISIEENENASCEQWELVENTVIKLAMGYVRHAVEHFSIYLRI